MAEAGIVARGGGVGLCYYTEQDGKRAKRTSRLPLGVWGAPDGDQDATTRTATLVVEHFRQHGFAVEWDGSGTSRPVLDLRNPLAGPGVRRDRVVTREQFADGSANAPVVDAARFRADVDSDMDRGFQDPYEV
ncbi:hypothetical protein O7627_23940 [Solwaraspora sp. WMMD1047]|uniref:DUF6891 domain-containing protein n=1 Tax=Solwaraspora sp. WMMD1047 TaxID=3016102 RepID=UPI002416411B|nr:hypothetical protein [Solwaraspora sp. WMMD1047]MDG4832335.1 hypothetical protein [Solwaraspora sp. WMMD1047]